MKLMLRVVVLYYKNVLCLVWLVGLETLPARATIKRVLDYKPQEVFLGIWLNTFSFLRS
jgi:hypothetical protein